MTLRVLMNADTVGGVWTYAVELLRAFHGSDVRFALATLGAPLSAPQRADLAGLDVDVFESAYRLEWQADPWADVERSGDWLLRLARELRPDVVHLNTFAHGALPFAAKKLVVGHSCVASWFAAVKGTETPPEFARYRREVARGLAAADAVIAPSRAMLGELRRHHGVRGGLAIANARNSSRFRPGPKEPFVLAAGRLWDEAKNVALLADVAPRLSAPVCVAGSDRSPDGSHRPLPHVTNLGLLDAATLAGWMSRAAIFAHPARYEPFGLSVLEAALSGCALVLGDIPSLRETWRDAAIFAAPDDREAWREALETLLADGPRRASLAEAALARARTFTPGRMATAYRNVYAQLADRPSVRARMNTLST